MIKETKAYTTTDGNIFGEYEEAKAHQAMINICNYFSDHENSYPGGFDMIDTQELLDFISDHRAIIQEYINNLDKFDEWGTIFNE